MKSVTVMFFCHNSCGLPYARSHGTSRGVATNLFWGGIVLIVFQKIRNTYCERIPYVENNGIGLYIIQNAQIYRNLNLCSFILCYMAVLQNAKYETTLWLGYD